MLRRAPSVGAGGYCRWWAGGGGEAGACTESLGSDSGDGGCDAADIDHFFPPPVPAPAPAPPAAPAVGGGPDTADTDADVAALRGAEDDDEEEEAAAAPEKRRRGGFPPAMPRATGALFLRAERRGGRLILTEVRADERERRVVFRARRDGGRLRLRFANDHDDDDKPEAEVAAGGAPTAGGSAGGVADAVAAVQHSGGGAGELCQVAAGAGRRGGVEVGAVMMGTTI